MPSRRGLKYGIGAGLETFGQQMGSYAAKQHAEDVANQRQQEAAKLAAVKDVQDKIAAGLDPEQGAQMLVPYGFDAKAILPHLQKVQPSVANRLEGVLKPVGAAKTYADLPTEEDLNPSLRAKGLNPIATSNVPSQFQLPPEMGESFSQTNPEAMTTLGAKRKALVQAVEPKSQPQEYQPTGPMAGAMVRPADRRWNPITQTYEEFGAPAQVTGTPGQVGANRATEAITQATGEAAGGLPTLKGQAAGTQATAQQTTENQQGLPALKGKAFVQQESVERPAKIATAAGTTRATTQAGIDVQTAPGNVTKEAQRQATIRTTVDKAVMDMKEAGVPPEMAESFVHVTLSGKPYAYIDPSTPQEVRTVATKRLATAVPGIRFLNRQQSDAITQLDTARQYLKNIMDAYAGKLPKDAAGRIIGGPRNTIASYMQTDPQLAANVANYGGMIEAFRASTAGVQGFRMTQYELGNAAKQIPLPTDTYATALNKVHNLAMTYQNIEKDIIDTYSQQAADRAAQGSIPR